MTASNTIGLDLAKDVFQIHHKNSRFQSGFGLNQKKV